MQLTDRMSGERRSSQRVSTSLHGYWKRGKKVIHVGVRDISATGMFYETDESIPAGHVMDLVVDLPSGPISFMGVARRLGNRGIGIQIFSMEPKDRARWTRLYSEHSARQPR